MQALPGGLHAGLHDAGDGGGEAGAYDGLHPGLRDSWSGPLKVEGEDALSGKETLL